MTLIWAYGQSGNEFYAEDELKYHSGRNRGRFTLGKKRLVPISLCIFLDTSKKLWINRDFIIIVLDDHT